MWRLLSRVGGPILVAALALSSAAFAREVKQFWHFTDTHLEALYKAGTDPETGCTSGKGSAGRFGSRGCDVPHEVVASSFKLVADTTPEFILWTGDMVPHVGPTPTEDETKEYIKNITSFLKTAQKLAGGVPVYPLLGNHDTFPQHRMTAEDWWAYSYAADLWKPFLTTEAEASFRKYGRYVEHFTKGLRIVAVNTVLYYFHNSRCPVGGDPAGQIAWIREQLASAHKAGDKVFLIGHIPPGWEELTTEGNGTSILREEQNDMFVNALNGFHDVVTGSFWGHVHTDSFKVWRDTKNSSAPSSPVFLTGSLDSKAREPAVRVFKYDARTFEPVDFDNYGFVVADANKKGKIEWQHVYRATTEYGIADLTAASLEKLHGRMVKDDTLFQKYYKHLRGNMNAARCTGKCRVFCLCAMEAMGNSPHNKCIHTMKI